MITFALAKGRLASSTMEILAKCGITSDLSQDSRRLVFTSSCGGYRFFLVKPSDVPTYVERGVADIGVVGKDTLMEQGKDVCELLNLGLAPCRMCICGRSGRSTVKDGDIVATKFVGIARQLFLQRGLTVDIVKLNGSVELAPLTELADVILDLVESGKTLEANGLEVFETVYQISARLIANKVSLKTKREDILRIRDSVSLAIGKNNL